jgi:type IX secretion system PorP/SprF family membrane protein
MKKIITIITLSVLVCNATALMAQPRLNNEQGNLNYRDHELLLNPATVGVALQSQLSLGVYKQWTGIEGAPLSEVLQYQMPMAQNGGLGAWIYNDSYGVTDNLQAGVAYAHRIPVKNNFLSFGLSFSALMLHESRVTGLNDPADPAFAEPAGSLFGFNAGFGAYYSGERFYAGVSVPQLLTSDIKDNSLHGGIDFARMQYYFTGGYRFDVAQKISLTPSALLELSGATDAGYEVMLTAAYNRRFELGAGWASPSQLQLMLGATLMKNLSLRYRFAQNLRSGYHAGTSHFIVLQFAWGGRAPVRDEPVL